MMSQATGRTFGEGGAEGGSVVTELKAHLLRAFNSAKAHHHHPPVRGTVRSGARYITLHPKPAMTGSTVATVKSRSNACAANNRSNGSRWSRAKLPARSACASVSGWISNPAARIFSVNPGRSTAASGHFPSLTLIAISHPVTALTNDVSASSRIHLRCRSGSFGSLTRH